MSEITKSLLVDVILNVPQYRYVLFMQKFLYECQVLGGLIVLSIIHVESRYCMEGV